MTNDNTLSACPAKEGTNLLLDPDEDDAHIVMLAQEVECGLHGDVGTMIPAHAVNGDSNSHPNKGKRKGRQLPPKGIVCLSANSYSPAPFVTFLPR